MATIDELKAKLDAARTAHEKSGKAVTRAYNAYKKALKAQISKGPLGIEEALNVYVDGDHVEDERGRKLFESMYDWLRERGILYLGSHYAATNQRQLKVALDFTWDDARLARCAELIEAVEPFVKPGALGNYDYGKPVKPTSRDGWKAFDIFEHDLSERGDYYLARREDGVWLVIDMRRARYDDRYKPEAEGDLMAVLRYIRSTLWYEGGPATDDDDRY